MSLKANTAPIPENIEIKRALLSVSDKTGIADFAAKLVDHGVELVSTGGTRTCLLEAGLPVLDISELTDFPELFDGRVKTLHPKVHGALLAVRDDPAHRAALSEHDIGTIDLIVVSLYPFEKVLTKGAGYAELVENIDIGGPAMIRSSAKNHSYVTVVTDPTDYALVIDTMNRSGGFVGLDLRKHLAAKAFAQTAAYDSMIATWFAQALEDPTPRHRAFAGEKIIEMRYGENPHQWAALYKNTEQRAGVTSAKLLQGKPLSYNNINDTDAAFECVSEFDPDEAAAVVVVKHANPCGVAAAARLKDAYQQAKICDPVSAFGGIVAVNRALDAETAQDITSLFTEVVIAPAVEEEALAILATKPNLRVLETGKLANPVAPGLAVKSVAGGLLVQSRDTYSVDESDLTVVTDRAPTEIELKDLLFAFKVTKHVKSNAIVYVKNQATVGVGAGQMSRVDSCRIAASKAHDAAKALGQSVPLTKGSVVASDAFFPFADGLLTAIEAGATAVIQPGGSMRDDDVIKAANEAGIAMVFTGYRHFRH